MAAYSILEKLLPIGIIPKSAETKIDDRYQLFNKKYEKICKFGKAQSYIDLSAAKRDIEKYNSKVA